MTSESSLTIRNLDKEKRFNKFSKLIILAVFILAVITCFVLDIELIVHYLIFCASFIAPMIISLYLILHKRRGFFYFFLSVLFLLGFFVKYSIHEIFQYSYVEPTGIFDFSIKGRKDVLLTAAFGGGGLFCSILLYSLRCKEIFLVNKSKDKGLIFGVVILSFSLLLAFINLKYNIILFGVPSLTTLPLKGNAIFYITLTRLLPFLLVFHMFNRITPIKVVLGTLLMLSISVGVLSRMFILIFFLSLFGSWLLKGSFPRRLSRNLFFIISIFSIFSLLSVFVSTNLRKQSFNKNEELSSRISNALLTLAEVEVKEVFSTYASLAVDRWIGVEGVMAVSAYEEKGRALLVNALGEQSYKGNSFYTKIAEPKKYNSFNINNKTISSSVPGPVAFSYYSGSKIIVFAFVFISSLLLQVSLDKVLFRLKPNLVTCSYLSLVLTLDFFQFGISPFSFLKYTVFTYSAVYIYGSIVGRFYNVEEVS
ncbi:hypothetical protein BIY24_01710 [Halobacteriovorax marinus]|uniref:hypothetical protein n=1 Tax=Halobacteriovorax marinus TaxID=97084 RepID=UPI000BC3523C|nr:hypothetical protein [Halobacteriovorax marinus]ATH06698.1 hypothetical protein BIY24_01710 [Halobacteriovorax marinus]